MDVYLNDKRLRLSTTQSIGKGGEADVFDIGGGLALKLWKGPDHPDIAGLPGEASAAASRLALMQSKMPAFPRGLPDRVVAPRSLATDKKGQMIVGYTMDLIAGAETLMTLSEPHKRRALGGDRAARVLVDLWKTVSAVHKTGVVMGDFNDLNVLVRGDEAHIVDADSFQFGAFPCPVFTERFVDPLLCDAAAPRPALARPFCEGSDWYAFAVMVMNTLLSVGPYGGVHRPKDPAKRVNEAARPLLRVTVFNPDVRYPKPAIPYGVLPDDLLHALSSIFEDDQRAPMPLRLLADLRFTACIACGAEHARARCPACDHGRAREAVVVRGRVRAARSFATTGVILFADIAGDAPAYVAHEGGVYRREDGSTLMSGPLDGALRFFLQGKTTFAARSGRVLAISEGAVEEELTVDTCGAEPAFAVNDRYRFFVQGGRLYRKTKPHPGLSLAGAPEVWGDVLAGQTRIWAGDRLGFGYYRAGAVSVAFTFDAERRGLRDTVRLPWPSGQLIAADAAIDDDSVWFFVSFVRAGRIIHFAALIGEDGAVKATHEASAGDGSWLGEISGKRAIGGALLTTTLGGVARVELQGGALVETKRFADTEPFVHQGSRTLAARAGLWIVDLREITSLSLG